MNQKMLSAGKRFFLFLPLIATFLFSYADMVFSQNSWVSTGGPLGGLGYDIRIHPAKKSTMYVTDNYAGVAKSDNSGQTWYQSNSGITIKSGPSGDAVNIFSLTIDPNDNNIIWAGTFGDGSAFGVFKSTDGGASWTMKTNGITLGNDIALVFRGFTIQKGNSNIVYAQAEVPTTTQGKEFGRVKGRVYKTTDGGENWQLIWQGNNLARYLIIHPSNPNTLYLSTGIFDREAYNSDCANGIYGGVGVLKSTDGGQTWTAINSGLTDLYVGSLRMHPTNSQILFAATGNNACSGFGTANILSGLFKTSDGGSSWTKVISGDDGEALTTVNFSPSNPDIVYAGSSSAFYRSEDNGTTWTKLTKNQGYAWGPQGVVAGFPIDVTIDPDDPYLLYANNYGGGVFRSTDGGRTWSDWSKGYTGSDIKNINIPADNPSAIFVIGRSGPYSSSNYGDRWNGIANSNADFVAEWCSIAVKPADSSVVLIADEHQGVIFRSTDGGGSFTEVLRHPSSNAGDPNKRQGFRSLVFSPSSPSIVYAGLAVTRNNYPDTAPIGTAIYKSTDSGATFSPMASIIDGSNVTRLVVNPDNPDIVYAATTKGVYKSSDGAANWTYFSNLGSKKIEALAVKSGYIIAGEIFGGIWISQNDGTTWTGPVNSGFSSSNPYITAIVLDPANSNIVYAGDLYSGVYKSTDKGLNWSPFPDSSMSGLTVRAAQDIALNTSAIYVATRGGGVFRYALQELCTYTISPTNQAFGSSGGTGSVSVTSSLSSCTWTVTESLDWVTITSGSSGTGSGTVSYSVSSNSSIASKTGNMTIAGQTFTISQTDTIFADVSSNYGFYSYIKAIYDAGITKGCSQSPLTYCPETNVTRGQMAAFIIRAKHGDNFTDYTTTPYFTDVPSTHTFFKYVQKLKDDNITVVTGTYYVDREVTRGEMAAFIIRAKYGDNFTDYTTTPYFTDVPADNSFFKYVQKMKDTGITASSGTYYVDSIVTRGQMAAFIARAFLGKQ